MKKILIIACGALLAASSCTSEVNEEGFIDKANTISFSAYPNKSRAVSGDVTSDNMKNDNFGVVGYYNKNIYLFKDTDKAVKQTWKGSSWEYDDMSDLRFWPNGSMDFYAYFPYDDNATFADKNSDENNATVDVMTIATTCAHDVLFAYAGNQSKQERVPLTFHHAFAKIMKLVIQMPADGMLNKSGCQIEVKGVEFINTSTSGTINVDNTGVASYSGVSTTSPLAFTVDPVVTVNKDATSGLLINNGTSAKGYFFATNSTPAVKNVVGTAKTMWDGNKSNITGGTLSNSGLVCLKLTCKVWNGADDNKYYYVGGADDYGVIYIPLKGDITGSDPLTQVTTFDAGKRYTYTIKMSNNVGYTDEGDPILTPILFKVDQVVDWENVNVTITL